MGIYFILACHSGDAFGVVLQPLPRLPIAVRYMEMVDIQKNYLFLRQYAVMVLYEKFVYFPCTGCTSAARNDIVSLAVEIQRFPHINSTNQNTTRYEYSNYFLVCAGRVGHSVGLRMGLLSRDEARGRGHRAYA